MRGPLWLRHLFSLIRIALFLPLLVYLGARFMFDTELAVWLALAYPGALALSWLFFRLSGRPQQTFIEAVLMDDWNLLTGQGNAGRWWNLWHYRNFKDPHATFGQKVKSWVIRIVIFTVIGFTVVGLIVALGS